MIYSPISSVIIMTQCHAHLAVVFTGGYTFNCDVHIYTTAVHWGLSSWIQWSEVCKAVLSPLN